LSGPKTDREGELSDSSNDEGPLIDNNWIQHYYYLAYKQLSAYTYWMKLYPAQAVMNEEFMVSVSDYTRINSFI
jgi:hypothetical protein